MKKLLLNILNKYLNIFEEESVRQEQLLNFLNATDDKEIVNWNNYDGHIVAGGFIYAKEENKFLMLYHKDLKMYLYSGGHAEITDSTPLETAKREVKEETGLTNLTQIKIGKDELIPIDIDTHFIPYNNLKNIKDHYHFDFRYLFVIERIEKIVIDPEESGDYKWVDLEEIKKSSTYTTISSKLEKLIKEYYN